MGRIDHAHRQHPITPSTWVRAPVSRGLPATQAASGVPLPRSLNDHPSKSPRLGAGRLHPPERPSPAKPQKTYSREVIPAYAGELEKILEQTLETFGILQQTEHNASVIDHSDDTDFLKQLSAVEARRIHELLGKDKTLEGKINKEKGAFQDHATGLYFEIHTKKQKKAELPAYVVAFPGTGIPGMIGTQWTNNIRQITGRGGVPPAYRQAEQLIAQITLHLPPGATLELTGHSLGGGIANYVGLKHDLPSTCFNAAALGKGCLEDLGDIPRDRLEKQLHLRIKSDWMSSARVLKKIQTLSSSLIPYAPRQVGKVYTLPNKHAGSLDFRDQHVSAAFRDFYEPKKTTNIPFMSPDGFA